MTRMISLSKTLKTITAISTLALACQAVQAADAESCKTVRFGMMNWTDLEATTAVAKTLLQQLGYETKETSASQPIIFSAIKDKRLDAFLGYWSPSTDQTIAPFLERKELKVSDQPNLADGQMTLAVPTWLAEKGLKTFSDIHRFKDELDGRIYGIDPGTDVNSRLKEMIDKNQFNLAGFKLIESGEAGMLSAVTRADRRKAPIVFLGWKPHPMNMNFDITYLGDSDDVLGPKDGKATVWTVTRPDYAEQCPNVERLLQNLQFTSAQESAMMQRIMNKESPMAVAKDFIANNPEQTKQWLAGVSTFSGGDTSHIVARQ
ncbi:choline ABC transporter substrate-binding protein [Pseudomonas sp. SH1-B]